MKQCGWGWLVAGVMLFGCPASEGGKDTGNASESKPEKKEGKGDKADPAKGKAASSAVGLTDKPVAGMDMPKGNKGVKADALPDDVTTPSKGLVGDEIEAKETNFQALIAQAPGGEVTDKAEADTPQELAFAASGGSGAPVESGNPTAAPAQQQKSVVVFQDVTGGASRGTVEVAAKSIKVIGQGGYVTRLLATGPDGNLIGQSDGRAFNLGGQQGTVGGVSWAVDPAQNDIAKVKGNVVFWLAALKQQGQELVLVNQTPVLITDMRYGQVQSSSLTYAGALSGRAFKSVAYLRTGQQLISVVEFYYLNDGKTECFFTDYFRGSSVNGRVDEGDGWQGCADISGGQFNFNIDKKCKHALNNQPQCTAATESASSALTLYPHAVVLFGLQHRALDTL